MKMHKKSNENLVHKTRVQGFHFIFEAKLKITCRSHNIEELIT